MLCEMCGTERGRLRPVEVEGVTMQLCSDCAKFGTEKAHEAPKHSVGSPQAGVRSGGADGGWSVPGMARPRRSGSGKPKKDALSHEELELVEDYPVRIRKARETLGISQEDLGKKMNEKKSVIAKLEGGTFRPDNKLIGKLERTLGIRLREKVEEVSIKTKDLGGPMTLGHYIKYEEK